MKSFSHVRAVVFAAGLTSLLLPAPSAGARRPPIDSSGGFSITVAFDYPTLIQSGYLDVAGFTEARYCDVFKQFSHRVWQASDGLHYVKNVSMRVGTSEADINWFFEGGTSYGSNGNSIVLQETADATNSPTGSSPSSLHDEQLGLLLSHEFGHYGYGLSDEYLSSRRGGPAGMCSSWVRTCDTTTSQTCSDDSHCPSGETCGDPSNDACDEDADCLGSDVCIQHEKRTGGLGEPTKVCSDYTENAPDAFTECEDDDDCAGDATCVDDAVFFLCTGLTDTHVYCLDDSDCVDGTTYGACQAPGGSANPGSVQICVAEESSFPDDVPDARGLHRSSIMASLTGGARWCDASTHIHERPIMRGRNGDLRTNGTWTNSELGGSGDPDFSLEFDEASYISAWDKAARSTVDATTNADSIPYMDLHDYYGQSHVYPEWDTLSRANFDAGPGANFSCEWLIDEVPQPGANTLVLVDASGSMDYEIGAATSTKPAFEWAAEGAALILENAEPTDWVGITTYNSGSPEPSGTNIAQPLVEASTLALGDDPYAELFDGIAPENQTDIGQAINVALNQFETSNAPIADRNIILMSDGRNTSEAGDTPLEAAMSALAQGVIINTLEYGDADKTALQEIADLTGGVSLIVGEKVPTLGLNADPQALKTDFVRAHHKVAGRIQLYENYMGDLNDAAPLRIEEIFVPVDADELVFDWIANEVTYCSDFSSGEHCVRRATFRDLDFWLESPSGLMIPASESDLFAASVSVAAPEAGVWKAYTDSVALPDDGYRTFGDALVDMEFGAVRELTRVTTVANMRHRNVLAKAWVPEWKRALNDPVTINASLNFKAPLTKIAVGADVFHDGLKYGTVWMYDDGHHEDNEPGDGVYGGVFNPNGDLYTESGKYAVTVRMLSLQGVSEVVEGENLTDEAVAATGDAPFALIEADTFFHLSNRYEQPEGQDETWPAHMTLGGTSLTEAYFEQGTTGTLAIFLYELRVFPELTHVTLGPGIEVSTVDVLFAHDELTMLEVGYEVAVDAPIGTHVATVRMGAQGAVAPVHIVCGVEDLSPPEIDAADFILNTCEGPLKTVIPTPEAFDVCGEGVTMVSGRLIQNGNAPADNNLYPGRPVLLSAGEAQVEWSAEDEAGNVTHHVQVIDVNVGKCGRGRYTPLPHMH